MYTSNVYKILICYLKNNIFVERTVSTFDNKYGAKCY